MNWITKIFLLLIILEASSCKKETNNHGNPVPDNVIKVYINSELREEYIYSDSKIKKIVNSFLNDSNQIVYYYLLYVYDSINNRISRVETYIDNDSLNFFLAFAYDNQNRFCKEYRNSYSEVLHKFIRQPIVTELSYNNNGALSQIVMVDTAYSSTSSQQIIFESGNLIAMTYPSGLNYTSYYYEYDNSKNKFSEIGLPKDNAIYISKNNINKFYEKGTDDAGNQIAGEKKIYTSEFVYNSDNYPVKEIREYENSLNAIDTIEYKYE
jgi:hypothetical protein